MRRRSSTSLQALEAAAAEKAAAEATAAAILQEAGRKMAEAMIKQKEVEAMQAASRERLMAQQREMAAEIEAMKEKVSARGADGRRQAAGTHMQRVRVRHSGPAPTSAACAEAVGGLEGAVHGGDRGAFRRQGQSRCVCMVQRRPW